MLTESAAFLLILIGGVLSRSVPEKNASVLISEYAKVAHWGSAARSSQGQKPWTQRSEGSISYGQNLKNYRSYDTSRVPAVGEVEERFNPKPFFIYGTAEKQPTPDVVNSEPAGSPKNYDSPVYLPTPPPTEVLPVPMLPSTEPKPHEDPYNSPYSSYNPPPKKPEAEDSYNNSQNQLDVPNDEGSFENHHESEDPYHTDVDMPKSQDMKSHDFDESYFPTPDDSNHDHGGYKEVVLDHPPPGYGGKVHAMADSPHPDHFPHYLYDEEHSGHHLYHEVEKPKEQKRVSKPQYSYYYIGRKLWYIPLYFSVYFIIYVTFLILKSIARHKIHFKHDLEDLHLHSRESRQLPSTMDATKLEDIHRNVTVALENGKRNFPLVVM